MNWLKTLFVLLLLSGCSDATPTSVDSASSGSQPADAASKSELADSQTTITPAEFSKVAAANSGSDADTDTDANTDANTETGAMLLIDRPENPNRLTIGDPAPPLKITTWLKGQPIERFEPNHIYVVEFWATWCGPCRESMPHLSSLQQHYAEHVTIVGVSDEKPTVVTRFLDKKTRDGRSWDEQTTYSLALDDEQATNQNYMAAAEQNHIPTAFIIGRSGRLEWFGAPADIDEPLKKIVAGTWNMAAARVKSETVRRQTQILSAALEQFEPAVEAAETSGNWDKPLAIINILLKSEPNEFSYQITKLELLNKAGRLTQFDKAAAALVQTAWGNPETLESIAWTIAAEQTHPQRDLKLALKAALQANALSENKNASMLDTLARVYFESGQLEQAIKLERKAIALEPDNSDWRDALKMFQQTDKTKSRQQDNAGRVEANSETE